MNRLALLVLLGALPLEGRAAGKISAGFQGQAGAISVSSGTRRIAFSLPQTAASSLSAGPARIRGGSLSVFLQIITANVQSGEASTQSLGLGAGNVVLQIPANALPAGTTVTLQVPASLPEPQAPDLAVPRSRMAVEILTASQPALPVTLSFSFANADLTGASPERFLVARYADADRVWVPLASKVDLAGRTVSCTVRHFSLFQVFQAAPPGDLGGVKVFPNPLRPGLSGHAQFTFTDLPAGSSLKVYTILGELLAELDADGAGMASWDGRNKAGASAASGVYLVLIRSGKAAKTVKVMVER